MNETDIHPDCCVAHAGCRSGRLLAGAGSVELVASVWQLHQSFIHPNINLEEIHPEISEMISEACIPTTTLQKEIDIIVKANFGFGDLNCTVVLKKWTNNG